MTDERQPTPEDLSEQLKTAGIDEGSWQDVEGKRVVPPYVGRQREILLTLRGLAEDNIARDQKKLAVLRQQLHRIRHGGGR